MRSGVLVVLGLLVAGLGGQGQSLSDRTLPAGRGFTLTLPSVGAGSVELAERILREAGVPFGIEQAPPDGFEPSPRLDRPITDRISFDGLSIREALDKIVSLDPRYEWEEANERILFRAVALRHSDALLQRRIPQFSVNGASASTALETLARLIAPSRAPGGMFTMSAFATATPAGTGRPPSSPPAPERFSFALGETTVRDALNALASSPGMSWSVRYDAPGGASDAATISLITPAATTVALSTVAMSRARVARPGRLVLPVMSELSGVVGLYALRAKLQTGFIRFPGDRRENNPGGYPPLDLTGLSPSEALDRIVALDSRYEWTRDDGLYLVRPRRDLIAATPLDMPVDEFSARDIGVDAILGRIVRLLAIEDSSAVSSGQAWSGGPEEQAKQRQARERPLSLTVRRTTVRGILNELCKEEGTLSWRASLQPDQKRGLLITIDLHSTSGWGVSRTFVAPLWEPR